jgi:hypothetical protein
MLSGNELHSSKAGLPALEWFKANKANHEKTWVDIENEKRE